MRVCIALVFVLLSASYVSAAEPVAVQPSPPNSVVFADARTLLKEDNTRAVIMGVFDVEDLAPGTDIILRYTSHHPFPVQFLPYRKDPSVIQGEVQYALLPAGEKREVSLSLSSSPGWYPGQRGITLVGYALEEAVPEIHSLSTVSRNTFLDTLKAVFTHPIRSEVFRVISVNVLDGYQLLSIPLTAILACILLFVAMSMYFLKRIAWHHALLGASVALLLVYHVRFLADLLPTTILEARTWQTEKRYNEMGNVYAVASVLREENVTVVTICGDRVDILNYLLHPTRVSGMDTWDEATHAILVSSWKEVDGVITCEEKSRPGTIIKVFPDDTALISFQEQ